MKLKLVTSMCNGYEHNLEMGEEPDVNEYKFANYIEIIVIISYISNIVA